MRSATTASTTTPPPAGAPDPGRRDRWLTLKEATEYCRCGPKLLRREEKAGRLRAARVGGRRELRFLAQWIDAWLLASTTIHEAGSPQPPARPMVVGSGSSVAHVEYARGG